MFTSSRVVFCPACLVSLQAYVCTCVGRSWARRKGRSDERQAKRRGAGRPQGAAPHRLGCHQLAQGRRGAARGPALHHRGPRGRDCGPAARPAARERGRRVVQVPRGPLRLRQELPAPDHPQPRHGQEFRGGRRRPLARASPPGHQGPGPGHLPRAHLQPLHQDAPRGRRAHPHPGPLDLQRADGGGRSGRLRHGKPGRRGLRRRGGEADLRRDPPAPGDGARLRLRAAFGPVLPRPPRRRRRREGQRGAVVPRRVPHARRGQGRPGREHRHRRRRLVRLHQALRRLPQGGGLRGAYRAGRRAGEPLQDPERHGAPVQLREDSHHVQRHAPGPSEPPGHHHERHAAVRGGQAPRPLQLRGAALAPGPGALRRRGPRGHARPRDPAAAAHARGAARAHREARRHPRRVLRLRAHAGRGRPGGLPEGGAGPRGRRHPRDAARDNPRLR